MKLIEINDDNFGEILIASVEEAVAIVKGKGK